MSDLTHIDKDGRVTMVDVGGKAVTERVAIARGSVHMSASTLAHLKSGQNKKGDVLTVAELAGIMGAKKTSELIPLCHPLPLTSVKVEITLSEIGVDIMARAKTKGQTGVEMEALTAVATACLTVYDMLKAVDKGMIITDIELLEKTGGKSGHYKK
ncbi:MAG: cyclic pyranopterin monophosphate synthase MoaC [Hellea sp.]|nr:cyclic pyranopterin monophosphate synthase MoaC [Hellea sp.]